METGAAIAGITALSVGAVNGFQSSFSTRRIDAEVQDVKKQLGYVIALINDVREAPHNQPKQAQPQQDTRGLASRVAVLEGQLANALDEIDRLADIVYNSQSAPPVRRAVPRTNIARSQPNPRARTQVTPHSTASSTPRASVRKPVSAAGRAALARNQASSSNTTQPAPRGSIPRQPRGTPQRYQPPVQQYDEIPEDDNSSVYADEVDPELLDALS